MDNLKLLRIQVAAKVAYLESPQARVDAGYNNLVRRNLDRAEAFREVLRDIDALESL